MGWKPAEKPLGELLKKISRRLKREQKQPRAELAAALDRAVGDRHRGRAWLKGLNRSVALVEVDSPARLQELKTYRRDRILAALKAAAPELGLTDVRFSIGKKE